MIDSNSLTFREWVTLVTLFLYFCVTLVIPFIGLGIGARVGSYMLGVWLRRSPRFRAWALRRRAVL